MLDFSDFHYYFTVCCIERENMFTLLCCDVKLADRHWHQVSLALVPKYYEDVGTSARLSWPALKILRGR